MSNHERWEQGSEFHLIPEVANSETTLPWEGGGVFFGTGRDAVRGLIVKGQKEWGWQRLWMPSYFCQTVARSWQLTGIRIEIYPDGPNLPAPDFSSIRFCHGDALLVVNYFGLRTKFSYEMVPRDLVAIIENHTHDPWSVWAKTSIADWCIASLRKTLPVPDGGVLWSPVGHPLPPEHPLTNSHRHAVIEKIAAMSLKSLYLEGLFDDKEFFRSLAMSGNRRIGTGEVSGMSVWTKTMLRSFPLASWRERRRDNHRALSSALNGTFWVRVLQPYNNNNDVDICPFSGILLFDTPQRRDYVRERLIASRVYPAILWSLESPVVTEIPQESPDFSRRMLSIHCDMRYNQEDMMRVAELIIQAGNEFSNG